MIVSVTVTHRERRGRTGWLLRWTSSTPGATYLKIIDGVLAGQVKEPFGFFDVPSGRYTQIEILDSLSAVPEIAYPGWVSLQWEPVEDAVYYRVDLWSGAAWVQQATVRAGCAVLEYRTGWLDDGESYLYRVVAVGANGIDSTGVQFDFEMVRRPDTPTQVVTYDAETRVLTIG